MLKAVFYRQGNALRGFDVSGHAGYGCEGNDIVCAAVSSAVMLTCNAVTDFLKAAADVDVGENLIALRLRKPNDAAERLLDAFRAHMESIAEEYSKVKVETRNIGGNNDD